MFFDRLVERGIYVLVIRLLRADVFIRWYCLFPALPIGSTACQFGMSAARIAATHDSQETGTKKMVVWVAETWVGATPGGDDSDPQIVVTLAMDLYLTAPASYLNPPDSL